MSNALFHNRCLPPETLRQFLANEKVEVKQEKTRTNPKTGKKEEYTVKSVDYEYSDRQEDERRSLKGQIAQINRAADMERLIGLRWKSWVEQITLASRRLVIYS
jgi:hypothetical protein